MAAACHAGAQVIDRVDIQRSGKEAEIVIRFTAPAQYLHHAPLDFGATLRIYARLARATEQEPEVGRETTRLPATDLVPRFTLTYPEADGALSITFDTPTKFVVRNGNDGKSIILRVPVLPNAQDWAVQMKGASVEPRPPAVPPPAFAPPATVAPPIPAAQAEARPPAPVQAAPVKATPGQVAPGQGAAASRRSIDSIEVRRLGKQAEIRIRFMSPARLARPTSPGSGELVSIFPQLSGGGGLQSAGERETNRVDGIDLVPHFTVTYPEADGSLALSFDRATAYSVQPGPDDRSVSVVVPILPGAQDFSLLVQGAPPELIMAGNLSRSAYIAPPAAAISTVPPVSSAPAAAAPPPAAIAPAQPVAAQPPTSRSRDVPAAAAAPAQVPAGEMTVLAPLTAEEIETRAKSAMAEAQRALASRRGVVAAERLGHVLALPPNSQTRLAQALIGEAREYSGELRKARAEYELYLKRYPDGPETARVKERLAALGTSLAQAIAASPGGTGIGKPAEWMFNGSFSQYSYRGNSQIEVLTPPPPGQLTFTTDKLSMKDQNSIISSLDLNARKRDAATDTRIVIRDTDTHNFLYGQPQVNRLYSAYYERTDRDVGYMVRAGRQLGSGGGVFGRFDGVWAGYNVSPSWRVNAVVGNPVEFGTPLTRSLRGLSLDRVPQLGELGYSLYYIEQPLEGLNDRRAVGAEGRYFDQYRTGYAMLDYDLNFQSLNIAMAQGNWRTDSGTTYFANADVRKTPPLSLLNALPAQQVLDPFTLTPVFLDLRTSFATAAYNLGIPEMRSQASMLTATSQLYSAGFMRPVSPRWQLGADYRFASISGTGDVGVMPAQPGGGNSNIVSGQALGTNLMLPNDTVVLNASLIDSPTSFGQSYNASYVIPYKAWRFDVIMRYYTQKDTQDQKQERISPTLKLSYRFRNSVSFELEAGNENVDEKGPLREQHSRRRYFFGGYRWDFR